MPTPVIVAPWGAHKVVHDAGEVGTAAGAGANMMAVSTACNSSLVDILGASEGGPRMFQLYLYAGGAWLDALIDEVIDLGFMAIVLTVDVQVPSRRDRSLEVPLPAGQGFATPLFDAAFNDPTFDPGFGLLAGTDWDRVKQLRDKIAGRVPFGLKGIMTAEDAVIAKQQGMDFIWVSNHGGRQLDYAQAPIDVLPSIVRAVKPGHGKASPRWPHFPAGWVHAHQIKPQIVIDGGFRRGTDVLQALALGADMVAMGTAFVMGLSAAGEDGVMNAYDLLAAEIDINLGLAGHSEIYQLTPSDLVRIGYPVGRESDDRQAEPPCSSS